MYIQCPCDAAGFAYTKRWVEYLIDKDERKALRVIN
jgi:hypothetical protein